MASPVLGVIVVTFNSSNVILDCLECLLNSENIRLAIVVVDNSSTDDTLSVLDAWASGSRPYQPSDDIPFRIDPISKPIPSLSTGDQIELGDRNTVTVIPNKINEGFAAGVNRGLAFLARIPCIDRFWIINPDSLASPQAARVFADVPEPFSLLGGRLLYLDGKNNIIQLDGGRLRLTGVAASCNKFLYHPETPMPDSDSLDFISGASMVASRKFYDAAGPMPEEYFLYYEEVDWASRRGPLPLLCVDDAVVWPRAGTSIGSGAPGKAASPMSHYFLHRGRILFVRRYFPMRLPLAHLYTFYRAVKLAVRGEWSAAHALLLGGLGLAPPDSVRSRLSADAQKKAFGRTRGHLDSFRER